MYLWADDWLEGIQRQIIAFVPSIGDLGDGMWCWSEVGFIKVHFLTPYLSHESLAYILNVEYGSVYRWTDFTALPGSYYQYIWCIVLGVEINIMWTFVSRRSALIFVGHVWDYGWCNIKSTLATKRWWSLHEKINHNNALHLYYTWMITTSNHRAELISFSQQPCNLGKIAITPF